MTALVWVDSVDPADAERVAGAKMGRLAEVHRAGVPVPRGFVVTSESYQQYCTDSGVNTVIDDTVAELGPDPSASALDEVSARVRSLFENTPMPDALATAITHAYEQLSGQCARSDVPTAVRSSAVGEDAADASFAGIFDTHLGVSGASAVLAAVRSCWASLFTARALTYRSRAGISHHDMPIAVGVVELIPARSAGVAFSVHPVTGAPEQVVIEASWGWGEAVVQGVVDPDHVEVDKRSTQRQSYRVAHKTVVSEFDAATGRITQQAMPPELADKRVLTDEEITAVTDAVTAIERHSGYPVDVEWVLPRDRRPGEPACVVQTRPVTVTAPAAAPRSNFDAGALARKYLFGG